MLHIPITKDINVATFKEYVSGLMNYCILCMECNCKTTYSSTMHKIIFNIGSNIFI